MAQTMFLPAATRYLNDLLSTAEAAEDVGVKTKGVVATAKKVNDLIDQLVTAIDALAKQNQTSGGDDVHSKANHMHKNIVPALTAVRDVVDRLERIVPDDYWPVPTYRDMLFVK
jgi:glutamine synthetase